MMKKLGLKKELHFVKELFANILKPIMIQLLQKEMEVLAVQVNKNVKI